MAHHRRSRPRLALALALVLAAGACSRGGGGGEAAPETVPTTAATTTTTAPPVFPLTGLPANDPARLQRPALTVKIENHPSARPQAGLDLADVVYEEVVEGGQTRFLAVFHSADADPVGPVRSVRPTDPDILTPLRGLFAYSGGTRKFIEQLRRAPVTDVGVDTVPGAYHRRRGKAAPHNLYSSTPALYARAPASSPPPPKLFPFLAPGQPFTGAGAAPLAHLDVAPGRRTTAGYDWDGATGSWKRSTDGTPHKAESGAQVAVANVIVQFVNYVASPGDVDPVGAPVTVAQLTGTGDAWVLAGGMVVKGRWSRQAPDAVTTFTDSAGAPLSLVPGRTWVELAQIGAPTTTR